MERRTDARTDGRTDSPCDLQDFIPLWGRSPKGKEVHYLKDLSRKTKIIKKIYVIFLSMINSLIFSPSPLFLSISLSCSKKSLSACLSIHYSVTQTLDPLSTDEFPNQTHQKARITSCYFLCGFYNLHVCMNH